MPEFDDDEDEDDEEEENGCDEEDEDDSSNGGGHMVTPYKDDEGEDDAEVQGMSTAARRAMITGVVPKDVELKKEMMSFISYPYHLESCCRLLTQSKLVALTEDVNEKQRLYMCGTAIMSTKLPVGKEYSRKACDQLAN